MSKMSTILTAALVLGAGALAFAPQASAYHLRYHNSCPEGQFVEWRHGYAYCVNPTASTGGVNVPNDNQGNPREESGGHHQPPA